MEKIAKEDGSVICRNYMYDGEYEDLTEKVLFTFSFFEVVLNVMQNSKLFTFFGKSF